MPELPLTTTKLLDCLRSPASGKREDEGWNREGRGAWAEIDARYRPVLIGFTRSLGLSHADAEDAAQWTLAEFARGLGSGQYERGKGRLRSWVMGIARHRVQMIKRSAARKEAPQGDDRHAKPNAPARIAHPETPDEATLSVIWERELERAVFAKAWALAQARSAPETLRAFELVVMRDTPPEVAASECGLSVESVYAAKSRITRLLKTLASELMARYEEDH
jgi:DNA-directed RNA polymerase specialized sigma24 family protein